MTWAIRPFPRFAVLPILLALTFGGSVFAGPKADSYWRVDDLQPGMKGTGRTVMKGTKIESFNAEVLGILKNVSPGRDLVLCRLSGLDLEKTGVIAGMSGSPVYIDGKLVGAVAYAWAFGKEPIAGITPFAQMHGVVERYERRDLAEKNDKPARLGLNTPLRIGEKKFDTVTIAAGFDDAQPTAADGLWLTPLRTPLAATGFSARSLSLLGEQLKGTGMIPVQGGGASHKVLANEKDAPLEPGSPLAVAMVVGDFDLSGIGTVTHVEGERVYGWGHPFFGIGDCDFPLMTGYIHTIFPRHTVSFKMGSPLKTVGVINADVSTCIAGWLGKTPDMMPMHMSVRRECEEAQTYQVDVVRQRSIQAALVNAVLTNVLDNEGDLPEELTANLKARIEVAGRQPLVISDTFSGAPYSGSRASGMVYQQVVSMVQQLMFNTYKPIRIQRIDCETTITSGRHTADVEAVEIDSETYSPGETVQVTAFVRPYKEQVRRLRLSLKLPPDMPEGTYTATISDDLTAARQQLRDNPNLSNPQNIDQVFESLTVQAAAKRTNLVIRVPIPAAGVALGGKSLPNLPPSMVQIIGDTKRTGAQPISAALVSRQATAWVVQGSESVRFTVAKNKRTASAE